METCSAIPAPPPSSLFANKSDTEVEVDYSLFFVCSDPEAILDDQSGVNFFEVQCRANNNTNSSEHGSIVNATFVSVEISQFSDLVHLFLVT